MKVVKTLGEFAKVGEDFKDEDILVIKDAGQITASDYGDRHVFKISTKNGDKNLTFNQTSMNNLIDAFGDDTAGWMGKEVKVYIVKQMIGDSLKKVCYLVDKNGSMTDNGKFVTSRNVIEPVENIDPESIPF